MSYEVVLQDKYYLREWIESISLTDSLDQISYNANIQLKVPEEGISFAPGQVIRISGTPFSAGNNKVYLLNPGVIWECNSSNNSTKHLQLNVYDRTIYLAKSEDEYLFAAGGTASQRLKKYAKDWGIQLANVPDTKQKLSKAIYRTQPLYKMITADLQETVKSGGDMYIPRMTPAGLELFKIGSNATVWKLQAMEEVSQSRTLEGAVTRVKVLGSRETAGNEAPSPVLAVVSSDLIPKLGTLQRMVQDEDVKTEAAAKKLGNAMLTGIQETFSVSGLDINTLRAGDKVELGGLELIVMSVTHQLGDPGHMSLELGSIELVKRRYFLNYG